MKYSIKELINYMENWAKLEYQESWDNSGNQIYFNEETDSVTVALDLTDKVIEEAIKNNSKLIITHHPMIFSGLKRIDENTYIGQNIIKLIKNNISVYSAHTSLDIAKDGVNDTLCEILNAEVLKGLSQADSGYTIGNIAKLKETMTFEAFINMLKNKLDFEDIRIYGRKNNIDYFAICGGSGASLIDDVLKEGINCFITGDVKHHDAQYAYENNLTLIDISHFYGERVVLKKIEKNLKENFNIEVKVVNTNGFEVFLEK